MKPAVVRALVEAHELETLERAAETFETSLENTLNVEGGDDGEILSHLLVSIFVKKKMAKGLALNEALREYSQKVRKIIAPAKK
ncbi:MAG TPA: hypothetical protein VM901_11575 [Bdellovibrionota bacterium]|nr:hypothetical protein [Bdellovibrionota bacterium]